MSDRIIIETGDVVVADRRVLTIDENRLVERINEIEDCLYRPTVAASRRRGPTK